MFSNLGEYQGFLETNCERCKRYISWEDDPSLRGKKTHKTLGKRNVVCKVRNNESCRHLPRV